MLQYDIYATLNGHALRVGIGDQTTEETYYAVHTIFMVENKGMEAERQQWLCAQGMYTMIDLISPGGSIKRIVLNINAYLWLSQSF